MPDTSGMAAASTALAARAMTEEMTVFIIDCREYVRGVKVRWNGEQAGSTGIGLSTAAGGLDYKRRVAVVEEESGGF